MPSIRNSYHSQDRDTAVNARGIADAVRRGELPSLSTYFEARNFRPHSIEALTKNALNNVKGTDLKADITTSYKYWDIATETWITHTRLNHEETFIGDSNIIIINSV